MFFSGCEHYCSGCHSKDTWDFNYGIPVSEELIKNINEEIDKRPFLSALVLSGGDPMYSAEDILKILPKIHVPNNTIWCYSGFLLEEIQADDQMKKLLDKCNVLIDGKFEIDKRIINAGFFGSSNQRIWRKNNNGEWLL
ncbi:anaerobic ribonucleoside-triphosphate reductase activating protein [Ruminococcus sp.]|uniref:anaerobic ribonucleoside-triphosphate reductase activating protein n=1 Tax=Ruminococcus sp. TaxID=41978 RepID=UPI003528357B